MSIVSALLSNWDGLLPINPAKYAVENGFSVAYDQKLEVANQSGYLDKEKETIFVNSRQPLYRQRFIVARELVRFLLEENQSEKPLFSPHESNSIEIQATQFASELLMPEIAVRELAPTHSLDEMAEIFDVSRISLYYRMKDLGLI